MAPPTAREQLTEWLAADGRRSLALVGRSLGISGSAVSQWLSEKSTPDSIMRTGLEILTGIAAGDWADEEERERLKRTVALATAARAQLDAEERSQSAAE